MSELRTVADSADRLAGLDETPSEINRGVDDAQVLRRPASGDHQQIELIRRHVRKGALDLQDAALLPSDGSAALPDRDDLRTK